jgi:hypothetical protein
LEERGRVVVGWVAGFVGELAAERVRERLLNVELKLRRQQELPKSRDQRRIRRRRPCWSGIDEVVDARCEQHACLIKLGAFSSLDALPCVTSARRDQI